MREWLKVALYAMGIALLFSLTRLTLQATKDIHQTAVQAQLTMTELSTTVRATRAAVTDKENGILAIQKEAHLAIRQGRKVEDVILQTSLAERKTFQKSSSETAELLENANRLVANLDSRTKEISDSLTLTLDQSQQTLAETSKAMDAAAGILGDPEIRLTLKNIDTTSSNAALMSSDAQKKFHLLLFPPKQPWYTRTLHFAETAGQLTFDALTLK